MSWTSKSDRFGTAYQPTAAAHIGPGHYKLAGSVRVDEHGYAPFGSTDPKASASKDARDGSLGQAPPPGAYDPKLPGKFDAGLPRKHVPFGASATRIDMKGKPQIDFRPGPGTYKVDKDASDVAVEGSRTMGIVASSKPILRSSSAPSIPQGHQSYGYEEVGGGRLVRQGPKDPSLFSSGRPGDSAGPGQYEPAHQSIRPRQLHGAFLKGPARVAAADRQARETPGPGHYAAKSSMELTGFNLGASFASGTERGQSKREFARSSEKPGPGSYAQHPDGRMKRPDLREIRSELQYFGSTVERFKTNPSDRSSVPDSLGPGSYADIHRKRAAPNVRGFCSTQDRFKGDDVKPDNSVGPGQYQIPGLSDDTMTGPMATYSMLGNSGGLAFGSMNKRFTYASDDGPGPGDYPLSGMTDDIVDQEPMEHDNKGRSRRKPFKMSRLPGAAFASRTPKDMYTKSLVREGNQKPPPGAYDPVLVKDQATVIRLRSKSEGFLAASQRFAGGPLDAPKGYHRNIGPGLYSPQDVTGGKRVGTFNRSICEGMPEGGRPKGLGFDGQEKRFKHTVSEKAGPGPGSYNTDPGWITKSHNCYFGDLT